MVIKFKTFQRSGLSRCSLTAWIKLWQIEWFLAPWCNLQVLT